MSTSFETFSRELRSLRPPLCEVLIALDSTPSTNDFARTLVDLVPGDIEPLPGVLVVAHEQTEGRGREGRHWWSGAGEGLWATLMVPVGDPARVQSLPLAAGIAICRVLREAGAERCGLKWPNDLVVGEAKIGGLLIEVMTRVEGGPVALVGFGINVGGDREKLEGLRATSLGRLVADPPGIVELAERVVRKLLETMGRLDDTVELAGEYRDLIVHREGDQLSWRQGGRILEGRFAGISDEGFLRLETPDGLQVISAGEVVTS